MDTSTFIPIARWINLVLMIFAIFAWSYVYTKCKEPGFIAPITWLVDVAAFYIFRFAALGHQTRVIIDLINLWSTVIIGHGIILLLMVAWIIHRKRNYFIQRGRRNE